MNVVSAWVTPYLAILAVLNRVYLGMEKIDRQLLVEILAESVKSSAMIESFASTTLDEVQMEKFTTKASEYREERLLSLLERYGGSLSGDDEEFLRSTFD